MIAAQYAAAQVAALARYGCGCPTCTAQPVGGERPPVVPCSVVVEVEYRVATPRRPRGPRIPRADRWVTGVEVRNGWTVDPVARPPRFVRVVSTRLVERDGRTMLDVVCEVDPARAARETRARGSVPALAQTAQTPAGTDDPAGEDPRGPG